MNAYQLTLGAVSVVIVDDGHGPMAGEIEDGQYFTARYPELDSLLDVLATHGWSHDWPTDDTLILHHCGSGQFVLTEFDYDTRRLPMRQLIELVQELGGEYLPAPAL